ncbi:hypothetical protein LC612_39880, partial [Nostoc sp. CHAB 5834]|nr:hypothetical protein [Nostoc sp. CHAB 5834]
KGTTESVQRCLRPVGSTKPAKPSGWRGLKPVYLCENGVNMTRLPACSALVAGIPVLYQQHTSNIPVVYQQYTSGIPAICQWYTSNIPAIYQWHTCYTPVTET